MQRRAIPPSRRRQAGYVAMGALLPRWFGRKKFNPRQFFPASEQGFVFEPWDFANAAYQDSTGITPVTAVEQSRGMVLDKRLGTVRGVEIVVNGTFAANSDWTGANNGGVSIAGGVMTVTNGAAAFGRAENSGTVAVVVGSACECIVSVPADSANGLTAKLIVANAAASNVITVSPGQTVRGFLTATSAGTASLRFENAVSTLSAAFKVSAASLKSVPGNHATQSSAASRPVVGARVNQFTKTEDFSDAVWAKNNTSATGGVTDGGAVAGPDGQSTGRNFVLTSASFVRQVVTFPTAINGAVGVWARKGAGSPASFLRITTNNTLAWNTGVSNKVALTTDWQYVPLTGALQTGGTQVYVMFGAVDVAGVGDATCAGSVDLWHPDLRTAGDAALAIPAYQRVNTSSDYDTVGFPVREKFDGLDDYDTTAAGGGSTTGFFYCGAVTVLGGAGAARSLWSDRGANIGCRVTINASNQLEFAAGNGAATTTIATVATLPVGETHVVTAWDDGVNLNVQVDQGAVASVGRPVVSAGTASITEGRDNGASSSYLNGALGTRVYRAGPPPDAGRRAAAQRYIARRAGVKL